VISLALTSQLQSPDSGSVSDDGCSVSVVAASIGTRDSASMRRMISGIVKAPAAAAAAKRNAQMRREPGFFITQNESKGLRLPTSSPPAVESSDLAFTSLQSSVTASILSFCATIVHEPTLTPCPLLTAAIARMQLMNSLPILPCTSRSQLRELLTSAVEKCGCRITEKCGFGSESFELEGDGSIMEENAGRDRTVFPVKLMLCCKNEDVMGSMTGVLGCFFEDWLESALHGKRRFVSIYVDVASMGDNIECSVVLECIVLQVSFG
jgi:hypothetical protein